MYGFFDEPERSSRESDAGLLRKSNKKPPAVGIRPSAGKSVIDRIAAATDAVSRYLGQYKDEYIAIRQPEQLAAYIDACIGRGVVAIDTETTGLDPMRCELVGVSLYTPGQRAAYIPIGHVSHITGEKANNQISKSTVTDEFRRLLAFDHIKFLMFNGKFDIRVLRHQLGLDFPVYWDCYVAARLMNENERDNSLKYLHGKYCGGGGVIAGYDDLFKGISFALIPISSAYIYAANDAKITFEFYAFQLEYLTPGTGLCEDNMLTGVCSVFRDIEMPLIPVTARIEDAGVMFDIELQKRLSVEYHEILDEKLADIYRVLDRPATKAAIAAYKQKNRNHKLDDPINVSSPVQVSILLYDILKVGCVDRDSPRGTGAEILAKIKHPFASALLGFREAEKLVTTYIDKLPGTVNPDTGRIHASFNQNGTATGRYSSSDPNLQNIPKDNKEIRNMFVAAPGHYFFSADYSQQEFRILAEIAKDEAMIRAYEEGRDFHRSNAAAIYGVPYVQVTDEQRQAAKAIGFGIVYGKGIGSIAEDLGIDFKKAKSIYDSLMRALPGLARFMSESRDFAVKNGFVSTIWGRKRRLPDMQLPEYEFSLIDGGTAFDPLDFGTAYSALGSVPSQVSPLRVSYYTKLLKKAYGRSEKASIIESAKRENINIKDNGGFIADATRQVVNSRIQGSAADQTKLAMLLIGNDPELADLGFRLVLSIHDELIGEGLIENAKGISERLRELMIRASKDLRVPFDCDCTISSRWHGDPVEI